MRSRGRWRYGERVQRVLYERKIGSKWKGKKRKKQRERENKEPWRLCLLAQSAIIPPPLPALTSYSGPASLMELGHRCLFNAQSHFLCKSLFFYFACTFLKLQAYMIASKRVNIWQINLSSQSIISALDVLHRMICHSRQRSVSDRTAGVCKCV